jgi:hypothetical protein
VGHDLTGFEASAVFGTTEHGQDPLCACRSLVFVSAARRRRLWARDIAHVEPSQISDFADTTTENDLAEPQGERSRLLDRDVRWIFERIGCGDDVE